MSDYDDKANGPQIIIGLMKIGLALARLLTSPALKIIGKVIRR